MLLTWSLEMPENTMLTESLRDGLRKPNRRWHETRMLGAARMLNKNTRLARDKIGHFKFISSYDIFTANNWLFVGRHQARTAQSSNSQAEKFSKVFLWFLFYFIFWEFHTWVLYSHHFYPTISPSSSHYVSTTSFFYFLTSSVIHTHNIYTKHMHIKHIYVYVIWSLSITL